MCYYMNMMEPSPMHKKKSKMLDVLESVLHPCFVERFVNVTLKVRISAPFVQDKLYQHAT